jgi:predicted nucleic acid-binding protein
MDYFFDSYAIIEIINQEESYLRFKRATIITNSLHLAEVYFCILRNYNEKTANYWISNLDIVFLDITPEIAVKASKLKYKHKKSKLSYADCIGYVTAIENNMKFVTGDKQMKGMKGVEFVGLEAK